MKPVLHEDFLRRPLAHRALHDVRDGRPENSRAAIRAACAAGYGIEIDIQRSADNQAMVFHDYQLSRLTDDTGQISDLTAHKLQGVELRGGEEGIPTLAEVLTLVAGSVPLLVEIKDQDGAMGPNLGPLEASVADVIKGYQGPLAVMSFNPHSVERMADHCPDVPRGLVTSSYDPETCELPQDTSDRLRDILDYDRLGCSFISHEVADLDRPRVTELRQSGAHLLCWTVKSPQQEAEARKIAENITFERYLAPFPT